MTFIDFIHKYMSVLDRIRSTKEWLPVDFQGEPHIVTPRYAKSNEVEQLDEKCFRINTTETAWGGVMWAGIGLFGLIAGVLPSGWGLLNEFGIVGSYNNDPLWLSIFFIIFIASFTFLPLPAILLSFVYPFKRPKERLLIWDRENGTVTLPPRFWGEHEVVPFNELKVKKIRNLGSFVQFHVLAAFRPSDGQPIEFGLLGDNEKDWAFFCWYMDKTRPLPPGEVFDPYRERDEERRRTFLQTLPPANIQQAG
ncbi:hypothetical protein [Geoalkalibacter subterraneus]|uniref:Uncharacterized protein n=1 Tax=Geoalkalibacter subterraneus TaxID=483547 RepID=A0A0B5FFP3_9BACT|nr:hypothetical protein [Geoalkalibacter subterraneus]AJF06123.1 hypothetical protein GSUB_05460 [Geoalkalibacter subterraneus]